MSGSPCARARPPPDVTRWQGERGGWSMVGDGGRCDHLLEGEAELAARHDDAVARAGGKVLFGERKEAPGGFVLTDQGLEARLARESAASAAEGG